MQYGDQSRVFGDSGDTIVNRDDFSNTVFPIPSVIVCITHNLYLTASYNASRLFWQKDSL